MIRYVGLDVHKRFIEVCILDGRGKAVFRGKTSCEREALQSFAASKLKRTDRVALESTTNWTNGSTGQRSYSLFLGQQLCPNVPGFVSEMTGIVSNTIFGGRHRSWPNRDDAKGLALS